MTESTEYAPADAQLRDYITWMAGAHARMLTPELAARLTYKGPYALLEQHGAFYDAGVILPDEWSGIIPVVPQHCYDNAQRLALKFPKDLRYVEGLGYRYIPTPHAWCVTRDGTVVDPTWAELTGERPAGYFGVPLGLSAVRTVRRTEDISVLFSPLHSFIFERPYRRPRGTK